MTVAIFEALGRQYKVNIGDRIKVDLINDEKAPAEVGTKVIFDHVLFLGKSGGTEPAQVGTPHLKGSSITARVVEIGKEKKGVAFKKKRRKGYRRKVGFRRAFSVVEIEAIQ